MKVSMIGLGKLGLPVAEVMSEQHDVKGYDTNPTIKNDKIQICNSAKPLCNHSRVNLRTQFNRLLTNSFLSKMISFL